MTDKLTLTVEFSADVEEEYGASVRREDEPSKKINRPFAFTTQPNLQLLPPVTRYLSPWGGKYNFVLVEHRPYSMVYDSGSRIYKVYIPWSYTLFNCSTIDSSVKVHKFFRPTQLYTTKDKLYIPWYFDRTEFDSLEDGLAASELCEVKPEFFDLNKISDKVNNDLFISTACEDIDDNAAARVWAEVYQINGAFLRGLEDMDQRSVVEFKEEHPKLDGICIDDLHQLAVASSVESIPTLREILTRVL